MFFRQSQTQLEMLLCDRHDRIAGQYHRTHRHEALQDATVLRSKNSTFGLLLLDHSAFGGPGAKIVLGHIECRSCFIKPGARQRATLDQSLDAIKIGLRLVGLGLQRLHLRIQRLHLEHELLVAHNGDRLAARDRVAFPDMKLRHRAADAAARRHHADTFRGRKHGLFVRDRTPLHA